jgi:large subunit ribosomal protein L3
MTQIFDSQGRVLPVTVIEAGPCFLLQRKEEKKDGYDAFQLGFAERREKRTPKPLLGHFKRAGQSPKRLVREARVNPGEEGKVGDTFTVEIFSPGIAVNVTGTTKGRGFAGVVKRHGFSGGDDTHGCTTHKQPGSIGASAYPSRVIKGKKLPGRMGGARLTVRNLAVIGIDKERNLLWVKGAVPGPSNGFVLVEKAGK